MPLLETLRLERCRAPGTYSQSGAIRPAGKRETFNLTSSIVSRMLMTDNDRLYSQHERSIHSRLSSEGGLKIFSHRAAGRPPPLGRATTAGATRGKSISPIPKAAAAGSGSRAPAAEITVCAAGAGPLRRETRRRARLHARERGP